MDDQLDEHRPVSKQSYCLLETVEKKALPPIEPPKAGKTRHHRDQIEQNTQTEMTEFNVIGPASNNVTDRKHRGNRKDAPNPLTGRISPWKKRIGIRVEPSKKKHHCGLFDGPPVRPERRQPSGFFHPGLASIQGNTNTFQPHAGVLRVQQSTRKFMVKETTKYRVDTVHGHRVPVAQEIEFGQIQGQKQKWKRRVLSPIKRRVDQSDEQHKRDDSIKAEHGQPNIANGDRDIPIVDPEDIPKVKVEEISGESVDHYSVNDGRGEINVISEPNAEDNSDVRGNENVEGKLRAGDNLDEEALGIPNHKERPDNIVMSGQDGNGDGDGCTTEDNNSDTAIGIDKSVSPRSAKIKDSIRELVESMVSRISPEISDNAEPNPSLFAPSDDSCSDNKHVVSIGIQTDWEELDTVDHVHGISNSPLNDGCGTCHDNGRREPCLEVEQSTPRKGFWLGTPPSDERQQHGCVESDSSCDKLTHENSSGEIQSTDDDQYSDMVHVTMSKGTMTPTMQGWRSLEDIALQGQESPVTYEATTPLPNPPVPVASQHILEVPGLGRMSMPLPTQHAVLPEISDMDVASGSVSNSDDHLPGMLIEDSGGDYTPAARTASRVSIFTLGHGDQRMGMSTPLGNIPSPSLGNISSSLHDDDNDLANESRSRESQASGVFTVEDGVQGSRSSTRTRPQTGDVQELIDNLIAERLNGVSVTPKNESVTGQEIESPPGDAVQSFISTNDEHTDHQCDMFRNDTPSSRNHSELRRNEETPSEDIQPDDVKTVTPTEGQQKAEVGVDGEGDEYVHKTNTDLELQGAFIAMEDAVTAAKLIIRYLGRTDARLREALHRSGPGDEVVVNCPAAERVAEEAHAFAVRTQSVFMTYFRLAEAEDTFREFVLKEFPGSEKERRQLRRWWTTNQPVIDDISDERSDVLEGEPEP